jgi:hypothetical protein
MQGMRIHRLFLHAPAHILQRMKKELYEIEQEARRLRAAELSRLLHAGASRIASLFKRAIATREIHHA